MFDRPIDLGSARILISNDDGINAPGLRLLEKVARQLCPDVWVVAPEQEQSGASHSLTLRRPLRIRKIRPRRFAVDGTPTDCVLLAIKSIMRGKPPTLVLSGINAGGNFGEDITYSGTVAAAMEATLLEVPAVALSQHYDRNNGIKWEAAMRYAPELLRRLTAAPWPRNTLVNVNFPDVPPDRVKGIEVTRQGRRIIGDNLTERVDPRGVPYYWIGPMRDDFPNEPGTDIAAVRRGAVSVTPIFLDLTNVPALRALGELFA
ncbi:MAG TPA: 5'/3'-nucleotidase SurE [Stellaceae bacterium]|nr:5'/3'-nucleotidase SurE [Stellaceae bacterium]